MANLPVHPATSFNPYACVVLGSFPGQRSNDLALADADTAAHREDTLGLTLAGGLTAGVGGAVTLDGIVTNPAWNWTLNSAVYVSNTAGELIQARPSTGFVRVVGTAITPTVLRFNPQPGQAPVGQVNLIEDASSAALTGTGIIPLDDTIPQITEGDEYFSVTITPRDTNNTLVFEAHLIFSHTVSSPVIVVALFQDSTVDCLACSRRQEGFADMRSNMYFSHQRTAGTESSTTFTLRAAGHSAGTLTLNGFRGARNYGGRCFSWFRVTELGV